GAMGGTGSEEFMVKSAAGEDTVAYCESCGYAANVEVAASRIDGVERESESKTIYEISTPNVHSIDELCDFLKTCLPDRQVDESQCAKSRIYIYDEKPVLILMLGNDEVNETKLEKVLGGNVRPAHPEELKDISGADAGSIGPVGFVGRIIADNRLKDANNMFSGANKNDYHIGGIDFKRDLPTSQAGVPTIEYADFRTVKSGEGCPKCERHLEVFPAIELGHIFKLGTKYSDSMGALFTDEKGEEHPIIMGSYGIGVERVMACYIEQNHDAGGVTWNKALAPFQVHLLGLNLKKQEIVEACEKIYIDLNKQGIEVLFDDRDVTAGFKFNDADLLGMPIQVVIGEKKLKDNKCEVKIRKTGERFDVELGDLMSKVKELLG
ncbi:MAG: YbaK/EbsC family protein, partial [Ignavibacteria bacterium]|nr:YbaK/EbsC family protein [Ignavibacteria bacterium]